MTKEKAAECINKELKTIFFDTQTEIQWMNNDNLLALTNNIMRKYNILPNDMQLNLNKAKKSAANSFTNLMQTFFKNKYGKVEDDSSAKLIMNLTGDLSGIILKNASAIKVAEMKNMTKMSMKEFLKQARNPNMNKTNSQDYLTYQLKQSKALMPVKPEAA
jgi:hypothetical protein